MVARYSSKFIAYCNNEGVILNLRATINFLFGQQVQFSTTLREEKGLVGWSGNEFARGNLFLRPATISAASSSFHLFVRVNLCNIYVSCQQFWDTKEIHHHDKSHEPRWFDNHHESWTYRQMDQMSSWTHGPNVRMHFGSKCLSTMRSRCPKIIWSQWQ